MLALLMLAACPPAEDTGVSPREFSDCDPIAPSYCGVPFPSTFYMREDTTSATGRRVHLGATTIPYTDQDAISYQPDPAHWNERDGFSPWGPILTFFPFLSGAELVDQDHVADSVADGASIVILDADTGERMPYFAELDMSGTHYDGNEMLIVHPSVALRNGHRYIVGIRGLTDTSGAAVAPSDAFRALRDGESTDDWDVEGRRDLYEDIFSKLEADGWSRGETLLAWDFVVKSVDDVSARIVTMREQAREWYADQGMTYTIDQVDDAWSEHVYRRVLGHLTVPLFTETDEAPTLLTRDADGMPYVNGTTQVPFTILVPQTAVTDPRPLPMIQYGHGLLGSQDEVQSGYLGELADRYGYVLFAVDWKGMAEGDYEAVVQIVLNDLGGFAAMPEREQQGYLEFMAASWMMRGPMLTEESLTFDGVNVLDADHLYYYGNSQGGILGGAYLAISDDITRGCLGVPGMPYSLLLARSADFSAYFMMFQSVYDDQLDIAYWMGLMQQLWDPGEAGGFARQMNEAPLAGVPAHEVLVQDAIGDAQVTTLGAQNMARAYGAVQVGTPLREVYGVPVEADGWVGNGFAEYDFGVPAVPDDNTPPNSDYDTHEDTRRAWAAQEQMHHFFQTGEVVSYCDGACLCATGACDAP